MRIAGESRLLALLCTLDLGSTVWMLTHNLATEANPLLRYYLDTGGLISFVGAKILLYLGPLYVLEMMRRSRPRFVQGLLRLAVCLYAASYVLSVWHVNG